MTTLHLGVVDIPYVRERETVPQRAKRIKKGRKTRSVDREPDQITTGDVAEILEAKYGVMDAFWTRHGQEAVDALTEAIVGQTENLLAGGPVSGSPYAEAESAIEDMFKQFLTQGEIEQMGIEGVPTQAAVRDVNHRLKKGRGKRRPSFVDTGLYQASFAAEVD